MVKLLFPLFFAYSVIFVSAIAAFLILMANNLYNGIIKNDGAPVSTVGSRRHRMQEKLNETKKTKNEGTLRPATLGDETKEGGV